MNIKRTARTPLRLAQKFMRRDIGTGRGRSERRKRNPDEETSRAQPAAWRFCAQTGGESKMNVKKKPNTGTDMRHDEPNRRIETAGRTKDRVSWSRYTIAAQRDQNSASSQVSTANFEQNTLQSDLSD